MVTGIDSFKEWFKGCEEQYAIIGGTACDILMAEEGLDFRATKDLDLVLIIEAVDASFGRKFWNYVKQAGYEHCNKSSGVPLKAKAWMDLTDRKAAGEQVDSKNIKKHKNDVFRLTELIDPTVKVAAPQGVFLDIQEFIQRMQDENVDIKQLGLVGRTKEQVLQELKEMYMLK